MLDENITWKNHILTIEKEITKNLGLLKSWFTIAQNNY